MRTHAIVISLLLCWPQLACHEHADDHVGHGGHDDHSGHAGHAGHDEHGGGHGGGISVTHWTDKSELFVEFPALVTGQDSAFAAHLTRTSDFRPIDAGKVTAILSGGPAPEERFEIDGPSVPGIFRPVARPVHAGKRKLTIELSSEALEVAHDLGEVTVHTSGAEAEAAAAGEAGAAGAEGISFLKEQQWKIDFAMAQVTEQALRPSVRAYGTLRPRADGEVLVSAPVSGRLVTTGKAFPRIGTSISSDQVLAVIAPRLSAGADPASLDLAKSRASVQLSHAQRERERLEKLHAQGAVPERRLAEARRDEAQARAELDAAERRLRQHRRVQRASGGGGEGGIAIRSPIAGTLVAVRAAPGAFVEEGAPLFHVVDLARLWLEVRVPEANVGRLLTPSGVWFTVEGFEEIFESPADRVVVAGGLLDERTRTAPLIFEIDNPNSQLPVGAHARVNVLTGEPQNGPVVPISAVVNEAGQDLLFVQLDGESFERRVVRLGARDRSLVQVLDNGVKAGEYVVTRGAYAIKLSAATGQVPIHAH